MRKCEIYATGTTGMQLQKEPDLKVKNGDNWLGPADGCLISAGVNDVLIFFWDPLEPLPHDQGIKAQLRFAVVVGNYRCDQLFNRGLLGS